MNCPKCNTKMIIDEWSGWVWTCFHCDYVGREATYEETEELEKELYKYGKNSNAESETAG